MSNHNQDSLGPRGVIFCLCLLEIFLDYDGMAHTAFQLLIVLNTLVLDLLLMEFLAATVTPELQDHEGVQDQLDATTELELEWLILCRVGWYFEDEIVHFDYVTQQISKEEVVADALGSTLLKYLDDLG